MNWLSDILQNPVDDTRKGQQKPDIHFASFASSALILLLSGQKSKAMPTDSRSIRLENV
jgi:hypothetical protein